MERGLFIFIVCFLRLGRVSHSIGLTIDNQLAIVANDCYTRIAIGSKLPDMDIFSSVAVNSVSQCEDECSKKRSSCNAFTFGIGIKGNGTCALSAKMPKPEDLQFHADYDVYTRSQRSPHCEADRLYKMASDVDRERKNETRPSAIFGSGLFGPTTPSFQSSPRTMGNVMPNIADEASYRQGYMPSFDDERRITDIVRNRNSMPPTSNPFGSNNAKIDNYNDLPLYVNEKSAFGQRVHVDPNNDRKDFDGAFFRNPFADVNRANFAPSFAPNLYNDIPSYKTFPTSSRPFDIFSRPIFIRDRASRDKFPADFGFWVDGDPTKYRSTIASHFDPSRGFFNSMHKNQGMITRRKQNELAAGHYDVAKVASRPAFGDSYNLENKGAKISNVGFKDTSDPAWTPLLSSAFRDFGAKITEKSKCKC